VTLPLILARERDPELRTLDLRAIDGPEAAAQVCDRVTATGALEEARRHALGVVAEAKTALPRDRLLDGQLAALELVADSVVDRYA
jgi:geranylgeranyl pyrophosphate synthase